MDATHGQQAAPRDDPEDSLSKRSGVVYKWVHADNNPQPGRSIVAMVTIEEAKTQFSRLLERVLGGEEITSTT